ncbi:MAG: ABC transporter permease [Tannerella sp.]|jgi:putative ABC transport system permease protein|nr:ABC transporter permease [Tannerella sp.]
MNKWLDVRSFFRFLNKNRFYTFINVFGLSVSLMFVILIAVYTVQELSVDAFHENAGRIYILCSENSPGGAYRLGARLQERYPEIESVCATISSQKDNPVTIGDRKIKADLMYTEHTFFDVFSFELVAGNRQQALTARNDAVISESFAGRAFPGVDPVGQTILLYDSLYVTVGGVMRDVRKSAVPYADILLRIENVDYFNSGLTSDTYSNYGITALFMLEREGADLSAREADMLEWFKEFVWVYREGHFKQLTLTPLQEIYFSEQYPMFKGTYNGSLVNLGDRLLVNILMWAGILILLFAVINYVNLTMAQAGFRAKEMATRRLLGSDRAELFVRLMVESTLLCLLSFAAGLTLAFLFAPYAGDVLERTLVISGVVTPLSVAVTAGVVLLLGAVSGLLPAIVMSNAKPVDIMKGSLQRKTKMVFSKGFIIFQNAVTIVMIATSLTMIAQVEYMTKAPLGYRTENLIDISMINDATDDKTKLLLAAEIGRLPAVRRTGFSAGTPFNRGNNHTMRQGDKNISFQTFICDGDFFDMIGWEKLRENTVSGEAYYLNERALKELEIEQDATTFLYYGKDTPVAGILRDFQLYNITGAPSPVLVRVKQPDEMKAWERWNLLIEVEGNPGKAYHDVKEVYERICRSEFDGKFIDRQVAASFDAERRTSRLMTLFTAIAILISLLGLLAMSTYFIRLRAKEVAIRKVMGSTSLEALVRLVMTFLGYVLTAFVIAAPVTWYLTRLWLSDYPYRIPSGVSPWLFVAAGVFCLSVSSVTVFFQSYAAATANPAKNLKNE